WRRRRGDGRGLLVPRLLFFRRGLQFLGRRLGFVETTEIAEVLGRFLRWRGRGGIGTGRRRRRGGRRVRGRGRRVRDRAHRDDAVGDGSALGTAAAPDEHAQQEDDDRHDGRRHEQEDELFPVQLDLVEAFVLKILCQGWKNCTTAAGRQRTSSRAS